jgi:hypothetical protein
MSKKNDRPGALPLLSAMTYIIGFDSMRFEAVKELEDKTEEENEELDAQKESKTDLDV